MMTLDTLGPTALLANMLCVWGSLYNEEPGQLPSKDLNPAPQPSGERKKGSFLGFLGKI